MKFGRMLALENASWNFPRVETLIIESTYGGKEDIMSPREQAEARLAEAINKAVTAGGHVLIPVPAVGVPQELLLVLEWQAKNGRLHKDARVLVEKMISDATAVHEAYPEYLARDLRQRIMESEAGQFGQFAAVESVTLKEPSVVLAPSSTLEGGPSAAYLKQIASDPKSRLVLVSYQPVDSPGRAIQDGARQVTINSETINLNCQIDRIDGFDSHSDYNQLINYVSRLRPKLRRVLVNHGERAKAQNLASSINRMFKIQTQHPLVQEAVKLL
jgi:hypothetical protein